MWTLADTALHLIDEANLISARPYGIELDLESLWRSALPGPDAVLDPGVLMAGMRASACWSTPGRCRATRS
jgi:hypothetical protein